ncbi:hypothetical protein [Altererythrobacter fulvus]|uniref:hypothetical protein n=1 Tax=Caenibius fulvus TaxID=2126012 RepID=UPI00301AA985
MKLCPLGRSIALNRAQSRKRRLVESAREWRWSSAHDLFDLALSDGPTAARPVLDRFPDIAALIEASEDLELSQALRRSEPVGRPLGEDAFLDRVAELAGRNPRPAKRGPKPAKA